MTAIPLRALCRCADPVPEAERLALIDESLTRDQPAYAGTGLGAVQVRSAHFSIAIGRALGSVVVAVHGNLDVPGARHLGSALADIIDGQGNLAVIVDRQDASAPDARGLSVLATAAERAGRRGATLTLADPPDELHEPLALLGLARLVHITHPRAAASLPVGPVRSDQPLMPRGLGRRMRRRRLRGDRVPPPFLGSRQAP